jgi:hypothetical protein
MNIHKIAKMLGLVVKICRYCKKEFIAKSPWQEVCQSIGCQRKRNAEKQKTWRDKKAKM